MNQAFIDGQNLYINTKTNGWSVDLARFRRYLAEKYKIEKAYYFLGVLTEDNQEIYEQIQSAGFILVFREHTSATLGKKKGNVDTDIVFTVMNKLIEDETLEKVLLVSGDGDYFKMVKYLVDEERFLKVLAPNRHSASSLYKRLSPEYIDYIDAPDIRKKIEESVVNHEESDE